VIILAVDIGTTGMKMGVYDAAGERLALRRPFSCEYSIRTYNDGLFSDIDPEKWKTAFRAGCNDMSELMSDIDVVALSGTTPGLTAMDANGNALYPAILMLDQRSREQAQRIIDTIGLDALLAATGNMPVAGGCSLASILWIKDNEPDVFAKARMFGHSNTYIARWLTGEFAIDPSSASLSALYNTASNDRSWNTEIARAFGLPLNRLPAIIHSYESPGCVIPAIAAELGLKKEPPVVIGGNDAVLAAYSLGVEEPGDIVNVNGTCEITLVCLPRCVASTKYNVRSHVLPERWLTLHVMNAGGKALDWFRSVFCSEIAPEKFYSEFLPDAIDAWLDRESGVTYIPYLMGSRYSLEPLKAEFHGLTPETTREAILAALVRGLCEYQKAHLHEVAAAVPLQSTIHLTGGAVNPALIQAKKRWMRDCEYIHEEQSSMKGAAMVGRRYMDAHGT
jgi:sugar (pentulose or hexulose) kinase